MLWNPDGQMHILSPFSTIVQVPTRQGLLLPQGDGVAEPALAVVVRNDWVLAEELLVLVVLLSILLTGTTLASFICASLDVWSVEGRSKFGTGTTFLSGGANSLIVIFLLDFKRCLLNIWYVHVMKPYSAKSSLTYRTLSREILMMHQTV